MRSILLIVFFSMSAALFAALKETDSLIEGMIDKYGGNQLKNDHARASGTIKYADGSSKSFTLTAKKPMLRMELQSAGQKTTVIRNGGSGIKAGKALGRRLG